MLRGGVFLLGVVGMGLRLFEVVFLEVAGGGDFCLPRVAVCLDTHLLCLGIWLRKWIWGFGGRYDYDWDMMWKVFEYWCVGKWLMYLSEEGWESWSIEMPTGVVLWWGLISAMQEEDGWTFWKFIFSWEVGRGFVWDWIVCGNKTTVIGELQMEWQGCSYGIWLCREYGLRTERLSGIMMLLASFKVCRLVALLVNYFNCPKWIEMS